jgi:hypothetical protein
MRAPRDTPLVGSDLARITVCGGCGRPFVVPLSVLGVTPDDRCLVELYCANCGRLAVGTHDAAAMEALDREIDEATAMLHEALCVMELVDQLERVDGFAAALDRGDILPEDF